MRERLGGGEHRTPNLRAAAAGAAAVVDADPPPRLRWTPVIRATTETSSAADGERDGGGFGVDGERLTAAAAAVDADDSPGSFHRCCTDH